MAITAFLSSTPGLLNRGLGGSASPGHVPHSSILSPTDWTSCAPGYIIVPRPPSSCGRHKSHSIQPIHSQGYILIFLDRMYLLFTQVDFLLWQLGRGQYVTLEWRSFPKSLWMFCSVGKKDSFLGRVGCCFSTLLCLGLASDFLCACRGYVLHCQICFRWYCGRWVREVLGQYPYVIAWAVIVCW